MVIDVHFHQLPPEVVEDGARGRVEGVRVSEDEAGVRRMQFPGRPPLPLPTGIADPDAALAHLAQGGVDRAVVTPWASAVGDSLEPAAAVAYSRALNDGLAELARGSGGRLTALAVAPTASPAAVAAELRRACDLGLAGVYLPTHPADLALDAEPLRPFWQAAEELALPVFLHPVNVVERRLERFNLANLLGNPMDTSIAACSLIFGGVLDRHPGLRVVLAHGGGTLPYGIGRLDHGFAARRGGPLGSRQAPSAYLRRFFYDAVVYRRESLAFLVATIGADRVMVGTDYPFDMEMPRPAALVEAAAATAADRDAILHGTAETLFGLS
jgi:aminocarboxymuconate-semialdehyde decarboxylase